ncbi:MAG: ABC transporter ATP-binding protein SaoA [Tepidibacter sp.]|jgi:NitT/TauT family transport system ATP-binding protein|uniref:ABC transporter ATP-binding protein SaoA n=1 Tax=Tepidibacter sp. TaxID=2529387 RepID=UPI0025E28A94|nr:ABC transporter ATP-binding protein SaoA [Tepidibacter sp.]MCT4508297.1 ABC transporter ATP-binding protein SaoA [Tepidibacter sp.]
MKLKINNVNKIFNNDNKYHHVLKDISMDIEKGQFVSILGPSGCGKTTLLTIVAGFQTCDSGEITVNSEIVSKPGPDRAFVFQNYALFPWMNVGDNIRYPMKQQKIPKEQREKRLNELLEMAQLTGKDKLYPHQISGGMKQRCAVIRALACSPEVLLMDEPLGAIDFQMRQNLQEELESLWLKDKTTVMMVTHDVDEAVYLSDRVIVMGTDKGKILEDMHIDIERPRNRDSQSYLEYKTKLTDILKRCNNK